MNRILDYLIKNIFKVVIAYFVFQFLLVIFWQQPFQSDSHYYYRLAQDCLKYHSIYPAKAHLYEDYIIAPLYVNLIVAALSIYNAQISIGFLNILLNALQMFLFFKLSERFTDRKTACVSLLLYMCYLNILGLVLINLTEMFFEVLVLSSLYFFYKDTYKSLFLAGVFAAASIAVRPIGWGLVAALVITPAVKIINKDYVINKLIPIILGLSLFIIALGTVTQISFGKFIYTSSTGPLNLLIGANDNSTGAFNARVFEKGNAGYIQNSDSLTYIEKGNFYEQKTKDWIITHPDKWISLIPAKIFFMFAWDDFTIPYLSHLNGWYVPKFLMAIFQGKADQVLKGYPFYQVILYLSLLILNYIYYLTVVLIFLIRIGKDRAFKLFDKKYLPVTLFIILGLLITLASYGDARYKYPYMLFVIFFIAEPVSRYLNGQRLFYNK